MNNKSILVTGSAGFIGSNLVSRLLDSQESVKIVGLDNMNNYYDPSLKEYRLQQLEEKFKRLKAQGADMDYTFVRGSIADRELVNNLFVEHKFDIVVNLAAQAGVRYSIENPDVYIESNIIGFYNILEACRHSMDEVRCKKEDVNAQPSAINHQTYRGVEHLVYAVIRRCHSLLMTGWIILYRSMPLRRRATS